jgi:hypothetical protein
MPHKFAPQQHIDAHGHLKTAVGEVEAGEDMFWITAFVWQNQPGRYAAAWGDAKWAGGKANHWDCKTKMAPGSQPFTQGKARAWALARVSNGGGQFFGWGHEVDLV